MNNEVRLPIETTRESDKITKVCVEDVYKMINRMYETMDKSYNNSVDVLESIKKKYWTDVPKANTVYDGYLVVGTGISQPCGGDEFDEQTGMDIAFMKAKLNANIKKYNVVRRVYNNYIDAIVKFADEMEKILTYIDMDIDGVRKFNPDYMKGRFEYIPEEDENEG